MPDSGGRRRPWPSIPGPETEPYCGAYRLDQRIVASVCLHREPGGRTVVLSPCGVCRERLAVHGPKVLVAVADREDPAVVVWKLLRDVLPAYWMTAFPDETDPGGRLSPVARAAPDAHHHARHPLRAGSPANGQGASPVGVRLRIEQCITGSVDRWVKSTCGITAPLPIPTPHSTIPFTTTPFRGAGTATPNGSEFTRREWKAPLKIYPRGAGPAEGPLRDHRRNHRMDRRRGRTSAGFSDTTLDRLREAITSGSGCVTKKG